MIVFESLSETRCGVVKASVTGNSEVGEHVRIGVGIKVRSDIEIQNEMEVESEIWIEIEIDVYASDSVDQMSFPVLCI